MTSEVDRGTSTLSGGGTLPSALKHSSESRRRAQQVEHVEESHSDEEQVTAREVYRGSRGRLPTPPPPKNVSFGELNDSSTYLEQQQQQPIVQYIPKHRHTGMYIYYSLSNSLWVCDTNFRD